MINNVKSSLKNPFFLMKILLIFCCVGIFFYYLLSNIGGENNKNYTEKIPQNETITEENIDLDTQNNKTDEEKWEMLSDLEETADPSINEEDGEENPEKNTKILTLEDQEFDQNTFTEVLKNNDFDQCTLLKSDSLQKKCLKEEDFFLSKTVKTRDECKNLQSSENRKSCLLRFTTEDDFSFDPKKCEQWPDPEKIDFCYQMSISSALSQGKEIDCNDYSQEIANFCAEKKISIQNTLSFEKSENTSNYNYCDQIEDKTLQTECKDGALFELTWKEKNIDLCLEISNEELSSKCIKEQGEKISSFFYRKAKNEKNKVFCLEIIDTDIQKKCINFFKK